ncbi:hypothetical protein D3C86_2127030 [compost metagenome]
MIFGIEANVFERDIQHVFDCPGPSSRDDIVVSRLLLQHQPHRADIVASMTPVTLGMDIP